MWIIQRPAVVTDKNDVSPTTPRNHKTVTEIFDQEASHRRGSGCLNRLVDWIGRSPSVDRDATAAAGRSSSGPVL
jgi:hypothetical protein